MSPDERIKRGYTSMVTSWDEVTWYWFLVKANMPISERFKKFEGTKMPKELEEAFAAEEGV